MKIIVVIPTLQKGGAERLVSVLTQEWIKNNKVKTVFFDGSNLAYSLSGDIINLNIPAAKGNLLKIIKLFNRSIKLAKLFKSENPDRIISFMESANFPSIIAAYFTGKLNKLTVSNHSDPSFMLKFQRILLPYLYRYPKNIVAISDGASQALINIGVKKTNLKIVNNPLPTTRPDINKFLLRPKNINFNYILAVGRLDKQKGFDVLIEAFSNVSNLNLHLVILGEGVERKNLIKIINDKGLSERVHLFGLVDDIWPWYRYARCFVSSSLKETWGNTIIEAMSQGCPVIAFDCDYGPREIITNRINGLLVKINDAEDLSIKITDLISDKNLRNKLINNGLIRSSEFNAKFLSDKWLKDN